MSNCSAWCALARPKQRLLPPFGLCPMAARRTHNAVNPCTHRLGSGILARRSCRNRGADELLTKLIALETAFLSRCPGDRSLAAHFTDRAIHDIGSQYMLAAAGHRGRWAGA